MAIEPSNRRRWAQLGLLGVALFASGAAAGSNPLAESGPVLRARAMQLFRAKKFAAACPLFEAAARRLPGEPQLLADLALCQHRIGSDELARQTNLDAIARASEPAARLEDPHFARIRRHAYFNLAELDPAPGESIDQNCGRPQVVPGCTKTFSACGVSRTAGGPTYRSDTTTIRVALTDAAARFDDGDPGSVPELESLATPSAELPVPVDADGALDYVTRFSEEQFTHPCEWTCESSNAVGAEVATCQAKPNLSPTARENCVTTVCARAEDSPWPAVKAELRDSAACYKYAATVDGEYGCNLVYANACTGLVGLLCSGHGGGDHETLERVEEYRFQAPLAAAP